MKRITHVQPNLRSKCSKFYLICPGRGQWGFPFNIFVLFQDDAMDEATVLSRAITILRKDILDHEHSRFDGSFTLEGQEKAIPESLKHFVQGVMYGETSREDNSLKFNQKCATICQTLMAHVKCDTRGKPSVVHNQRLNRKREQPLQVFLGMKVHLA